MLERLRDRARWLLAGAILVACGEGSGGDGDGDGDGGAGETGGASAAGGAITTGGGNNAGKAGATGGNSTAGGTTTGGRNTGGGGASTTGGAGGTAGASGTGATSGAPSSDEHCSPGKTYENFRAYEEAGGPIANCYDYDPTDVGQPAGAKISIRSIALAAPLAADASMAFSIEWIAGGASIEFWGTNEQCGAGAERLGSATSLAPNITCSTWQGTAEYGHVLMVWTEGGGQHGDVTICEAGSCAP